MNYTQIAEKIKETLEKNFLALRLRKQAHFAERMYRISGKKKYILPIKNWVTAVYFKFLNQAQLMGNKNREKDEGRKRLEKLKGLIAPKKWARLEYYQNLPELKFYQELIFSLMKIKEYQLKTIFESGEAKKTLDFLKEVNWKKYFLDEKLVYLDPVQTINHVFWLKRLKIIDLVDEYLNLLQKIYPPDKIKKDSGLEFHNHCYSYSHAILSASDYYQRFVDPSEYAWIINFWEARLEEVFASSNIDLIAEIGVALKLTKQRRSLEKIKKRVAEAFNQEKGYRGKDDDFNKLEHTNALAIILFSEPFKLYPGPKIKKLAVI